MESSRITNGDLFMVSQDLTKARFGRYQRKFLRLMQYYGFSVLRVIHHLTCVLSIYHPHISSDIVSLKKTFAPSLQNTTLSLIGKVIIASSTNGNNHDCKQNCANCRRFSRFRHNQSASLGCSGLHRKAHGSYLQKSVQSR